MFNTHQFRQTSTVLSCLLSVFLLGQPTPVQAGCGCTKAPPVPAAVRPHATYAGTEVTLFHADLQSGQGYDVTFTSGITGESVTVDARAIMRRDLADGVAKAQLVVPVPELPLGPTSLSVTEVGQSGALMVADDTALTVVPQPIVLSTQVGETALPDFQAAVGRDGTVYVSLDLAGTHLPRTFQAHMQGYPLRFTNHDVLFLNTQGFVMQLLDEGMPGLYDMQVQQAEDSTILQYSRHEFATHFLHHAERQAHAIDPDDVNWHLDDTPHINHDQLILAIASDLADGSLPTPGATPPFDMVVHTFSLFHHGILGIGMVNIDNQALVDSYHSETGTYGAQGHVHSNTQVIVQKRAFVDGDVMAPQIDLLGSATVTGELLPLAHPNTPMPIAIPANLEDLGSIVLALEETQTIVGPGSFRLADLILSDNTRVFIDNTAGPVTIYLTGQFKVTGSSQIHVTDPNPEKLALYIASSQETVLTGNSVFYGVIYAPESKLTMAGKGEFFGAFTGQQVVLGANAQVHFDPDLRGQAADMRSETPSTDTSETTTTAVIVDSLTSTETTTSTEPTTLSSSPGNGKGKK